MRSILSPSLRSRYDYYYSTMSPGSAAANFYENQNQSLFGDPVPPATDFLETLDSHLYGSLRRSSIGTNQILDEKYFGDKYLRASSVAKITSPNVQKPSTPSVRRERTSISLQNRPISSMSNSSRRNSNEVQLPIPSKRIFSNEPLYIRRMSNTSDSRESRNQSSDSVYSDEWIEPDQDRLPNKNTTQTAHSVTVRSLNGRQYSTTSSSESRPSSDVATKKIRNTQIHVLPYVSRKNSKTTLSTINTTGTSSGDSGSELIAKKRELSPAIIKETVTTGSAYRIQQPPRQHKKTSFAIINELSPNRSETNSLSGRSSPFRGKGFKPSSRNSSRPESPQRNVFLSPHSASVDGINTNHLSVHFDINPSLDRSKTSASIITPKRMAPRTIEQVANYYEPPTANSQLENNKIQTDTIKHKPLIQISSKSNESLYNSRPYSVLPDLNKPKPFIAPRKKFFRSTGDLTSETTPAPSSNFANPGRSQKGLLKIVNTAVSPSKIPRRRSVSTDGGENQLKRKDSVAGPNRISVKTKNTYKSTDQLNANTDSIIDLGVPLNQPRSLSRISRPTTLSPIVGTPNKDDEQRPQSIDQEQMEMTNTSLLSPTRIPLRTNSNLALKHGSKSRVNSRSTSREPSPGDSMLNPKSPSLSRAGSLRNSTAAAAKQTNKTKDSMSSGKKSITQNSTATTSKKSAQSTTTTPRSSIRKAGTEKLKSTNSIRKKEISSNVKSEETSGKNENTKSKNIKNSSTNSSTNTSKDDATKANSLGNKKPPTVKREPSNLSRKPSSLRKSTESTSKNSKTKTNSSSKIEKQKSFRKEKTAAADKDNNIPDSGNRTNIAKEEGNHEAIIENGGKLVPFINSNVVSMTAAAIAADPVQISTAVTNHSAAATLRKTNSSSSLIKTNSSNQLTLENSRIDENDRDLSLSAQAQIIEKSTKTLENIQKTVTEATDEIQKTIEVNLTDLKSLEQDMRLASSSSTASGGGGTVGGGRSMPVPLEKRESSRTLKSVKDGKLEVVNESSTPIVITTNASPIDAVVSVVENLSGGMNSLSVVNHEESEERVSVRSIAALPEVELESGNIDQRNLQPAQHRPINSGEVEDDKRSENGDDDTTPTACCGCSKCCNRFCIPCRSLKCCQRKNGDQKSKTPIDQTDNNQQTSCWSCCKKKSDKTKKSMSETTIEQVSISGQEEAMQRKDEDKNPGKCRLCIEKFICCRKTNKIESVSPDEEVKKCCFCIPWRKVKRENIAWEENRRSSNQTDEDKPGCCSNLCSKLLCCRKKSEERSESRRTSMTSKKQSIAPTIPPEDTRPKLDMTLVEHASLMKGAIPVLPVCLAWFCLICNCFIPGFGTLWSGLFCLCLGIPRFSQHDGAKARIGSFIINIIVAVSQTFTLIFCLVGWGWSIWWGTIMLRIARKHKKIKLAEAAELQSEHATSQPNVVSQNHRDVEANVTS